MYRIVLCDDCGADISTLESHLNELKNKKILNSCLILMDLSF